MNLKPCPFCGGEAYESRFNILCKRCFFCADKDYMQWNERHGEREIAKRIVRLLANYAAEFIQFGIKPDSHFVVKSTIQLAKLAAKEGGLVK